MFPVLSFWRLLCAYLHAKSLQSCSTVRDPVDCSLPGSSVHGDSPGKNAGGGCHALLPRSGIKPESLTSPALAGGFLTTSATLEAFDLISICLPPSQPLL